MRYLTKEWYNLCQKTCLHFGLEVNEDTKEYSDELYQKLYRIKEQEYITEQQSLYDSDPRSLLLDDGATFIPLHKFIEGEELAEEDYHVYHMPEEMKQRIQGMIETYDARPLFDENQCRHEFYENQSFIIQRKRDEIAPYGLLDQIADIRVFALGYCTSSIFEQLKRISQQNEEEVNRISEACRIAARAEQIPEDICRKFGFHDCKVTDYSVGRNIMIQLDTSVGFTNYDKITFVDVTVINQEEPIIGSIWIYDELYRTEQGYEVHVLFCSDETQELTICCSDIIVEIVDEESIQIWK